MMKCRVRFFYKFLYLCVLTVCAHGITFGQSPIRRDTLEREDHHVFVRVVEDDNVYYEESFPGCYTSKISIARGIKELPPAISFFMPYDSCVGSGRTHDSEDVVVYTFLFENDQFLIIYIDKDYRDKELHSLPPVLSRQNLYDFVNGPACRTELYVETAGESPKSLADYFNAILNKNSNTDDKRENHVVHRGYCTILLFNVLSDELERFIESANSLEVYELNRVFP